MPGLVPGIHVCAAAKKDVDGRDKPGHDGVIQCEREALWKAIVHAFRRILIRIVLF